MISIKRFKAQALLLFAILSFLGFTQAKEAHNFTGYYRELTPLCDKKLDANPQDLSRYSGIENCYEGKKHKTYYTEFWVIQNGANVCGVWESRGSKIYGGALVGIYRDGKASVFYEDGHALEGPAHRFMLEKNAKGILEVSDFDDYGFPKMVIKLTRLKTLPVDALLLEACRASESGPSQRLLKDFEFPTANRPNSEMIRKTFGDLSEKVIYKAPPAKAITIDKKIRSFRYVDDRSGNNFVPRDVLVRNLSNRPWFVKSHCYPESENYFSYRLRDRHGVVEKKYQGYALEAMDSHGGAKVNPNSTIRVLSCRFFSVEFDVDGDFHVAKDFDVIKN